MKEPSDHDSDGWKSDKSKSSKRPSRLSTVSRYGSRYSEDNADETQGEPSYFDDTDSDLEGSSSSYQDFEESSEDSRPMESSAPAAEEKQEEVKKKISINFYYNYLDLVSRPFVTSASLVPLDTLTLVYPFQLQS